MKKFVFVVLALLFILCYISGSMTGCVICAVAIVLYAIILSEISDSNDKQQSYKPKDATYTTIPSYAPPRSSYSAPSPYVPSPAKSVQDSTEDEKVKDYIHKAIWKLRGFCPPGYLFDGDKRWNSQESCELEGYLRQVNSILRVEDRIKVPYVKYTNAHRNLYGTAGYTDSYHKSDIFIDDKYRDPNMRYACYYILIHEYMHHFLEQNRLAIRDNVDLNEILTDCAVVYFGFENIMSRGRQECLKRSIKIGYITNESHFDFLCKVVNEERDIFNDKMYRYWVQNIRSKS